MKASKVSPKQLNPQMQKVDRQLRKASQMYEEQFLREMVRAMRKSVGHSALTKPNFGERIYREQLDDKYVSSWVKRGGTGFGDMIYNQLVDKFYPQLANKVQKPIRPVNISDRFQGVSKSSSVEKKQAFQISLAPKNKETTNDLRLPWSGKLEKNFSLENGKTVAVFSHPQGLNSTFVFQGQMKPGLLHKDLQQGEFFAQLHANARDMTWQIQEANSRKGSSEPENSSFN